MIDYLIAMYPWLKAGHIISVISWMAGIFYLPRLFVHHSEKVEVPSQTDRLFSMMESKLLKVIMTPAMLATWGFGLSLTVIPGVLDWSDIWPWVKLMSIIAMTWFHFWLAKRQRDFELGDNQLTGKTYRIMNEVPTVLLLVIVIMVVVRPF
ncbi:MAG TPA: protoporphyrinogen oxidase HemJ [Rhodobacteraceae bacterium]|jgi:putative membrane protein|nr:protoporphyrinogen oxidase HemJ [Paracoccaceae bacterium]